MLESLVSALEDWGVPPARIHFEAFGPASIKRRHPTPADAVSAVEGQEVIVTFARRGKQITWRPESGNLLEFAEANGVTVNSGCRAGSCGSCQTTIKTGEVTYRHPPDYDPEPGTCLMCVCTPKTDVTLEA
jgi:ferredoxin